MEHKQMATPIQQAIERVTALIARPMFLAVLAISIACWIGINLLAYALGYPPFDAPPFPELQELISLSSLFLVVIVLTTQRRDDQLAQLHEQLNLQLAILNEQKTSKVIELLEELRRDDPFLKDRVDEEAESMASSTNTDSVLEGITVIQSIVAKESEIPDSSGRDVKYPS